MLRPQRAVSCPVHGDWTQVSRSWGSLQADPWPSLLAVKWLHLTDSVLSSATGFLGHKTDRSPRICFGRKKGSRKADWEGVGEGMGRDTGLGREGMLLDAPIWWWTQELRGPVSYPLSWVFQGHRPEEESRPGPGQPSPAQPSLEKILCNKEGPEQEDKLFP